MPTPKKRLTRSRRGKRRSHDFLLGPTVIACANCGSSVKPHLVCASCGYYKGQEVVAAQD